MGKFDGILICTDLDGTLYKNDKTISDENMAAIEYFKAEGGFFTFITGRMPYYTSDAFQAVKPNVPFGCINGGGVYDGSLGKYVWTCKGVLDAVELVKYIDENVPTAGIQLACFDKTYFCKETKTTAWFREVAKIPKLLRHYNDVDEPVGKILFSSDSEEDMLNIERLLRSHPLKDSFSFIRSEKKLFEILEKGVDKGLALRKLIEYLGVDPKRTVAVGDYYNDIGMFKTAAMGVAVANACDEAKKAADYVTVSNEEHAIAHVIADIESGKYSF